MEFDKSKVLTVVTADQAKVGQEGWFANIPKELIRMVNDGTRTPLAGIANENTENRFISSWHVSYALFYPAPEPTYAERQAEWVKENGIKEGDKVRIVRNVSNFEDGWSICWATFMDKYAGKTGVIDNISFEYGIYVEVDNDGWWYPYFVLEPVKEKYRPFKSAEEFKPYRDKWLCYNGITIKHDGYYDEGIIIQGEKIYWTDAFNDYKFEDGTPFGIKEEA